MLQVMDSQLYLTVLLLAVLNLVIFLVLVYFVFSFRKLNRLLVMQSRLLSEMETSIKGLSGSSIKEESRSRSMLKENEELLFKQKVCPHCGMELPLGDVHAICPFCGRRI